jgi:signal transduction histidine kinase
MKYSYLNSDELIFAIVTIVMILFAIGIIAFVFIYNKKIHDKKEELRQQEISYQKELVNAMISSREEEQRRIAQELHDDVGSTITAIKFSVSSLTIDADSKAILSENLNKAIAKVRRLSNELQPSVLEELGLLPAVNNLIKGLQIQLPTKKFAISMVKDDEHNKQTKEVNLALYRVIQELINNIIKYAEATEISILLIQNKTGVQFELTDNGIGFAPTKEDLRKLNSLGLKNIASRLQQINGELKYIKQKTGTKTTVTWTT